MRVAMWLLPTQPNHLPPYTFRPLLDTRPPPSLPFYSLEELGKTASDTKVEYLISAAAHKLFVVNQDGDAYLGSYQDHSLPIA